MPRIIRSHAAAPRGHGCTRTTKKREGVLMIATISTFLSTRIAIRNNSETEIAIRDKIQTNPNKSKQNCIRQLGFDDINDVNACEFLNYNG